MHVEQGISSGWLYLIPVTDSVHSQHPRPCPLGCSSRSAWWCVEEEAESRRLLAAIGSTTPSGRTLPCQLRRWSLHQYKLLINAIHEKEIYREIKHTYRHSDSGQRLTCSPVYTCTCSFLWCWDTQHSYRSQAKGTHWCLWNMQYDSHTISGTFWLWKHHEVIFFL